MRILLSLITMNDHNKTMRILLEMNSKIDIYDKFDNISLILITLNEYINIIKILMKFKVNIDIYNKYRMMISINTIFNE